MKRLFLYVSVLFFWGISYANAITIAFNPANQTVVGRNNNVDVVISDLTGTQALGAYDLDIEFDSNKLHLNNVIFSNQLDVLGLGSIYSYDNTIAGLVNIFEISIDFPTDLQLLQADSFIMATFGFTTTGYSFSLLDSSINALADEWGEPLESKIISGGITTVPEPSTLIFFLLGFVSLLYIKLMEGKYQIVKI